jgi:hypothetical protein
MQCYAVRRTYHHQLFTQILIVALFSNSVATLPFHQVPAIVSEQRQKELKQRKATYQWAYVSDDMPGNINAKAHSDLPRDVQFTDEKSRYLKCMGI